MQKRKITKNNFPHFPRALRKPTCPYWLAGGGEEYRGDSLARGQDSTGWGYCFAYSKGRLLYVISRPVLAGCTRSRKSTNRRQLRLKKGKSKWNHINLRGGGALLFREFTVFQKVRRFYAILLVFDINKIKLSKHRNLAYANISNVTAMRLASTKINFQLSLTLQDKTLILRFIFLHYINQHAYLYLPSRFASVIFARISSIRFSDNWILLSNRTFLIWSLRKMFARI